MAWPEPAFGPSWLLWLWHATKHLLVPLTSRLIPCFSSWARLAFSQHPSVSIHHFFQNAAYQWKSRGLKAPKMMAICRRWPICICSTAALPQTSSQDASSSLHFATLAISLLNAPPPAPSWRFRHQAFFSDVSAVCNTFVRVWSGLVSSSALLRAVRDLL